MPALAKISNATVVSSGFRSLMEILVSKLSRLRCAWTLNAEGRGHWVVNGVRKVLRAFNGLRWGASSWRTNPLPCIAPLHGVALDSHILQLWGESSQENAKQQPARTDSIDHSHAV